MHKILIVSLLLFLVIGCRNKKTALADTDEVGISDFVEFFPEVNLPFQIDDDVLLRGETDSSSIGFKIFTQFIPDSILHKQFGAGARPKIYPLGRVSIKKFETYLFLKAISSTKKAGYIIALDKDYKFIAGMPLVVPDKDATTSQVGLMDKKYTVTKIAQKKKATGESSGSKDVFILNADAGAFSLIMTDQGIAEQEQEIINPIDTLPRKNKYSGDYFKDKRNYISIRDGKKPADMLFFIHFEKDNGACAGELKGAATLHGVKTAQYQAIGNPCVLEFTFGASSLTLKELAACGSYRDIKCLFDGSFVKRKEPKSKVAAKKKL